MAIPQAIDDDLALLGTPDAPRAKERLLDHGPAALARIFAILAGQGEPSACPRDGDADLADVIVAFAYDYRDDFVKLLDESRAGASATLVGLAPKLPAELGEALLLAGLDSPSGQARWEALTLLHERAHPEVKRRLHDLLWDGHELVVFAALRAAAREGDARVLPRLVSLAEAEGTPVGARHHAWEAIEAIAAREGLADVPRRPPPQLVRMGASVPIFNAWGKAFVAHIFVSHGEPVKRGQDVAEIACAESAIVVPAPCDGVVVDVALQEGDECRDAQPVVWIEGPVQW